MPLAFGTEPETIPAPVPYLAAPAERASHIGAIVLPPRGLRAGFVWSGSRVAQERRQPLDRAFAALFACLPACRLPCVSLQRELRDADREVLRGLPNLIDLGAELSDFADTAAVISLLDVVISVDTAVAHLAGALGKPVVILLPHAADFRWMRGRDDTPWYPTRETVAAAGLWRLGQRHRARLADELREFAGARARRPEPLGFR